MNNKEALTKLEALRIHSPEAEVAKNTLINMILLEDRIYVIEKKLGLK